MTQTKNKNIKNEKSKDKEISKNKKKAKRVWKGQRTTPDIVFVNPEKCSSEAQDDSESSVPNENWNNLKKIFAESKSKTKESTSEVKKGVKRKIEPERKTNQKPVKRRKIEKQTEAKKTMTDVIPVKKLSYADTLKLNSEDRQRKQSPKIWFDDVDPALLEMPSPPASPPESHVHQADTSDKTATSSSTSKNEAKLVKPSSFEGLTSTVALDCEMVGVGKDSILARVSIVNLFGHCIYDTFVKPKEKITDYRTHVSGVRPEDLKDAPSFEEVQKKVFSIIDKRVLVGHAIWHDLKVLYMSHPKSLVRDTARFSEFKKLCGGKTPSLKKLSETILGVKIQSGEHSSVEDARATMRLYTMYKVQWEKQLKTSRSRSSSTGRSTNNTDSTKITSVKAKT